MHARNRTWLLGSDPVERCRQRTLPVEGGDGSTLSLDFTTGVLDPRLTFTRSTTGTFINASGLVASAAINTPRFDYDPTTLQPRGLLIEGSASNLLFWSESFASSGAASNWAYNGNTAVPGATTTNPAGGTTAFQFAETANSGPLQQSATVTNVVHTFSAWFKASTYNSVTTTQVSFGLFTTGFLAGTASIVSGPGSTAVAGNIVTLSGLSETQWTRVQFTTTAAIPAGAVAILIYPQTTGFEVNRSFYIWGAQLETGSGASSYIPTGASQGNRDFDSCVMTGTNFSSWFAGATEGVLYAECERPRKIESTAVDHAIVGTRYASGQGLWVYASATNQYPSSYIFPSGGAQFAGGIATRIPFVSKQAVRWFNANDITNFGNGTQGTTNTAGTGTMVPTMLTIGANSTSGTAAGLEWFNGGIRRVKFWPVALSNAQIQALTT